MRVYLPATLPILATALDTGLAARAGTRVVAVTDELRAAVGGDEEQHEYAAQALAAEASLGLLRADPSAPRRRVVLALDVDELDQAAGTAESTDAASIELPADVPLRRVASALVDDPSAGDDVAAATAAGETDPESQQAVTAPLQDHELLWFAAQELGDLLA